MVLIVPKGPDDGYNRDVSSSSSSSRSSNYYDNYVAEMQRRNNVTDERQPRERKIQNWVDPKKVLKLKRDQNGEPVMDAYGKPVYTVNSGNRIFESCDSNGELATSIVIAMDVTRSRGDDVKIILDKLPLIFGATGGKSYLTFPQLCCIAVGDATCDKAPIQTTYFENDERLDEFIARMWLEKGGGGTGQESYELAAYMMATRSRLDSLEKRGQKGFFFFIGDEGFYPQVSKDQVKEYLGEDIPEDLDSVEVFQKLQEQYEVFFIFPKQSWEERRDDIEAEMRTRVIKAGGQYDEVSLRATLMWNTYDDLDLHCQLPDGGHIYFSEKRVKNGELDVDRNAGKAETNEPVENIRWPLNSPPAKGRYRFSVHNYAYHDNSFHRDGKKPIPFEVELEHNGHKEFFKGKTTHVNEEIVAFDIDYDPAEVPASNVTSIYSAYEDENVKALWASAIPEDHILILPEAKAIIDVIIGVLALRSGVDLETYLKHLEGRGQTTERRSDVIETLSGYAASLTQTIEVSDFPAEQVGTPQRRRRGDTQRI